MVWSHPSGSSEAMNGGNLPGTVCRTSGSLKSGVGRHRHSKPSCASVPMGMRCQATVNSSAAWLGGGFNAAP